MKLVTLIIALLSINAVAEAQIFNPVKWDTGIEKVGEGEYVLIFQATIDDGWYVYSSTIGDDGPVATTVEFDTESGFERVGEVVEVSKHRKEGYDDMFEMQVVKFSNLVTFKQKIKTNSSLENIVGYLTFMTCDNERCLPPTDVEFDFSL